MNCCDLFGAVLAPAAEAVPQSRASDRLCPWPDSFPASRSYDMSGPVVIGSQGSIARLGSSQGVSYFLRSLKRFAVHAEVRIVLCLLCPP
ncbi:hypothetical protein L209DRAFT_755796 [Thermothelomyces heterothallicus CBS 203.75]